MNTKKRKETEDKRDMRYNDRNEGQASPLTESFCEEHPKLCKSLHYGKFLAIGGLAGAGAYQLKKVEDEYRRTEELSDKVTQR